MFFYFLHFLWNFYNDYQLLYNSGKCYKNLKKKKPENYKSEPNNKSSISPFRSLWCPFTMSSVFQFACYGWKNGKFYCFSFLASGVKSQMVTRLLFPSSKYYLANCIEFSSLALAMYLVSPHWFWDKRVARCPLLFSFRTSFFLSLALCREKSSSVPHLGILLLANLHPSSLQYFWCCTLVSVLMDKPPDFCVMLIWGNITQVCLQLYYWYFDTSSFDMTDSKALSTSLQRFPTPIFFLWYFFYWISIFSI